MYESEARKLKLETLRDSKYFIPYTKGGYSKYTNVRNKDSLLPNCTGGAYGLSMQYLQTKDYKQCTLPRADAGNWYPNCDWEKSKFPVIGAVICWGGNGKGHVGIVLDVERDKNGNALSVTVIESSYYSYNKRDWRIGKTYKYNASTGTLTKSNYKFQGYLLNPNIKPDPVADKLKVGDLVQITGKGNSRKDGKGKTSGGVGYKRYILKIFPSYKYPYQIGNAKGTITGYYQANALKKL